MSTQTDEQPATEHPIDRACKHMNGRSALASALGVKPSAIGNWKDRGVPLEHCLAIERACGGVVTRRDLRPDDCHRIWPDLAMDDGAATPQTIHPEV